MYVCVFCVFFFKQKTAYELRISDWSSDVCSSDLMTVGLLATLTVPLVWLAPAWLEKLGLEPSLLDYGQGYTRAMALTLIPMLGVMLYRTILTAAEKPKVFLQVTLAMLPLNALGNYVSMAGARPSPALGPPGARASWLRGSAASPPP